VQLHNIRLLEHKPGQLAFYCWLKSCQELFREPDTATDTDTDTYTAASTETLKSRQNTIESNLPAVVGFTELSRRTVAIQLQVP